MCEIYATVVGGLRFKSAPAKGAPVKAAWKNAEEHEKSRAPARENRAS